MEEGCSEMAIDYYNMFLSVARPGDPRIEMVENKIAQIEEQGGEGK